MKFLNILFVCNIFLSFGVFEAVGNDLDEVICNADDQAAIDKVGAAVRARMSEFPLFADAVTA